MWLLIGGVVILVLLVLPIVWIVRRRPSRNEGR
jgi:hypothetical protein